MMKKRLIEKKIGADVMNITRNINWWVSNADVSTVTNVEGWKKKYAIREIF